MDSPLLEMSEVSIASLTRPDLPEIENLNWQLRSGDFWIIGGLHGSGKSDFIATAGGLQRPINGAVRWQGRDIWMLDTEELVRERMRIGVVFENGGRMFRHLTVMENIALPIRYHRDLTAAEAEKEVHHLLEATDLVSRAHTTTGTLSIGWQQRVGMARALALQPEILLVDEPVLGTGHTRWWLDFLRALSAGASCNDGKPVSLVVTVEDLRPWKDVGRQFAVLRQGKFHALGGREELVGKAEPLLNELWTDV